MIPMLFILIVKAIRGPEFTKEKDPNTYRIFVIGDATIFNVGVLDDETWAYYLQQLFNKTDLDFKVKVINLGYPFFTLQDETDITKSRFIDYDPDLFVVYDGFNDTYNEMANNDSNMSSTLWYERQKEICELRQHEYDILITMQPFAGVGKKILAEQENLNLNLEINAGQEK